MTSSDPTTNDVSGQFAGIVPRWEWRTFGQSFGTADAQLETREPSHEEDTTEIYLLALGSDASVKVRNRLMDVKRLEAVDPNGLEQWRPVMKATFPISADEVSALFGDALGARVPQVASAKVMLDELLDDLVERDPTLRAVEVDKHRVHYTVGGCMAELTDIRTNGKTIRSIAIESEDPAAVIAAVRELGLEDRRNVNVPRGLKALVGFGAKRYAAIDVGTNSVKLHIGELRADGEWTRIADRAEVTRLGEQLADDGMLLPEAKARTIAAIISMAHEADQADAVETVAVGTAGLRNAADRDAFVNTVEAESGVRIEVISGEEEARLAYLAAKTAVNASTGTIVVFDTGGGSSQFTLGHGDKIDERFSLDVGAVRVTEHYALDRVVSKLVIDEVVAALEIKLARLAGRERPQYLVGMGGAVTNMAAVKLGLTTYDPDAVHRTTLDYGEIGRQIELYRSSTAAERRAIPGLQPSRAEVILAGACIVRSILENLGSDSLIVSDRGLRHGLLVERFEGSARP